MELQWGSPILPDLTVPVFDPELSTLLFDPELGTFLLRSHPTPPPTHHTKGHHTKGHHTKGHTTGGGGGPKLMTNFRRKNRVLTERTQREKDWAKLLPPEELEEAEAAAEALRQKESDRRNQTMAKRIAAMDEWRKARAPPGTNFLDVCVDEMHDVYKIPVSMRGMDLTRFLESKGMVGDAPSWPHYWTRTTRNGKFTDTARVVAWFRNHNFSPTYVAENFSQVAFDFYCDNPKEGRRTCASLQYAAKLAMGG